MRAIDVDNARVILRALGPRPVVLGTFGLVLHGLLAPEHAADVDVLVEIDEVPALIDVLLAHGYAVVSWQDPLTTAPSIEALKDRVYVRGDRDGLVVDVTYEGIDVALWRSDATVIDDVTVASVERILSLKRARGAEKDLKILRLLK